METGLKTTDFFLASAAKKTSNGSKYIGNNVSCGETFVKYNAIFYNDIFQIPAKQINKEGKRGTKLFYHIRFLLTLVSGGLLRASGPVGFVKSHHQRFIICLAYAFSPSNRHQNRRTTGGILCSTCGFHEEGHFS